MNELSFHIFIIPGRVNRDIFFITKLNIEIHNLILILRYHLTQILNDVNKRSNRKKERKFQGDAS